MKMLHTITVWIRYIIAVIVPTLGTTSNVTSEDALRYNTVSWKLDYDGNTYASFLTSLRKELSVGEVCKIPVLSKTPKQKFVLVDIVSDQKTMTLALDATNTYFVGYRDKYDGEYRANFVKERYAELKASNLFSEAKKYREELPFKSDYPDIERVAGGGRGTIELGVTSLITNIDTVYGKQYSKDPKPKDIGKNLARFALKSIQMVAEASRFKYIEEKVIDPGMYMDFKPDATFLLLENNWGTSSAAIHKSSPKCGPVKINGLPWDDIKTQVRLLKYKDSTLNVPVFGETHGVDAFLELALDQ